MKKKIVSGSAVFSLFVFLSWTFVTDGQRMPAAAPSSTPAESPASLGDQNLSDSVRQVLTYLQSREFNATTCGPVLKSAFAQAMAIRPDRLDSEVLRGRSTEIIRDLFAIRIALHDRLAEFDRGSEVTDACLTSVRDALRAARVVEDYVSEWHAGYPKHDPNRKVPAFTGEFPYLQTAGGENLEFRSGDVFLSRGTAFTSAAIARITDDDANFSHLGILYIDEKTKQHSMVEAHIEIGSTISTFETYKNDGKARSLVFRFHDAKLAHEAAQAIYNRVKAAEDSGERICYNFGMNIGDPKCLYCSEVISSAYQMASRGAVKVPRFPSRIQMKNRDFLDRLGVTATVTFAPADIELDPRFQLIAEWRDLTRVNMLHEHDAILTAMFDWMERENYVLHPTSATNLKTTAAWHVRRWPLFGGFLKEKFPKNMLQSTLAAVTTLDTVGGALMSRLTQANESNLRETGYWLTPMQMLHVLESYRNEDLRRFEAKGNDKPHFHHLFRKKQ